MSSPDALKRMPKFKRCKITTHQLNVLVHNFGAWRRPNPTVRQLHIVSHNLTRGAVRRR